MLGVECSITALTPPTPCCCRCGALAGLLYHQQVVAHLPDKVVCIRPLLLYLYVSLALGWAFFVQDHQLNRCRPGNKIPIEIGSLVFVGVTRVA